MLNQIFRLLIKNYQFRKYAFADCIKDVARLLFGFSENQLYGNGKVPVDATQPQDQERPLAGGLIGAVQSGMKRCSAKKEAPAPSQK